MENLVEKKISEDKERTWYKVSEWETEAGLKAQVRRCEWNSDLTSLHDFFTGYVQVPEEKWGLDVNNIDVHWGVTFPMRSLPSNQKEDGEWDYEEGKWIGFDMSHAGDEDNQDLVYAERECEKMARQVADWHRFTDVEQGDWLKPTEKGIKRTYLEEGDRAILAGIKAGDGRYPEYVYVVKEGNVSSTPSLSDFWEKE